MASESGGVSVPYTDSLSISDKRRYLEKTKEIGCKELVINIKGISYY